MNTRQEFIDAYVAAYMAAQMVRFQYEEVWTDNTTVAKHAAEGKALAAEAWDAYQEAQNG